MKSVARGKTAPLKLAGVANIADAKSVKSRDPRHRAQNGRRGAIKTVMRRDLNPKHTIIWTARYPSVMRGKTAPLKLAGVANITGAKSVKSRDSSRAVALKTGGAKLSRLL